ncbi:uncharacterized protein LOC114711810 [Neltuma alba]|uniref:uncharacterized protein LOC114711810 n=1 Tax=Neltuma alba TaxID=207710 RepID=UPI0010A34D16|nr:uncharacterized protein LOC114711810 [Prosopis alba]
MLNGTEPATSTPANKTTQNKGWRKILELVAYILSHNDTTWLEDTRGNLSLVAIMISTITFQSLINPPGGFVQQDIASDGGPFGCLSDDGARVTICPGDAVSAVMSTSAFHRYQRYSTACFIGSLWVTLLLVSGVPLKHKPAVWVLSLGMCTTLTFLTLTYLQGLFMVNPDFWVLVFPNRMISGALVIWFGILGVIALLSTLRFAFWLMEKGKKKFNSRQIILCDPRSGIENA